MYTWNIYVIYHLYIIFALYISLFFDYIYMYVYTHTHLHLYLINLLNIFFLKSDSYINYYYYEFIIGNKDGSNIL